MLNELIPNFIYYFDDFKIAIKETLQMMLISGSLIIIIGLIIGVFLVVTKPQGILENKNMNRFLDAFTNLVWSIPFFILYMMLFPTVSFLFKQKSLSVIGAIIPLVIGGIPFFIRQVESALLDIDAGLIEAAQSMGLSNKDIIIRVYLKESIPSLARGASITLIVLFGLTTIAGSFGPGGLGIFVKRYGHDRNMRDILYISVFVIILIVSSYIAKKTTH